MPRYTQVLGQRAGMMVDSASRIGRRGKDSSTSTSRWIRLSTQPPKYPLTPPSTIPMENEIRMPITPTVRLTCEPTRVRDSRSRPNLSVPSGK